MLQDVWATLVEVISNRFVPPAFNVHKVFFEADVKDASCFADVEFSAFGTMNDIYSVLRQAVELYRHVHLGFGTTNGGAGVDEGICSAVFLITRCSLRLADASHQHATDIGVAFECDQWWLTEDM